MKKIKFDKHLVGISTLFLLYGSSLTAGEIKSTPAKTTSAPAMKPTMPVKGSGPDLEVARSGYHMEIRLTEGPVRELWFEHSDETSPPVESYIPLQYISNDYFSGLHGTFSLNGENCSAITSSTVSYNLTIFDTGGRTINTPMITNNLDIPEDYDGPIPTSPNCIFNVLIPRADVFSQLPATLTTAEFRLNVRLRATTSSKFAEGAFVIVMIKTPNNTKDMPHVFVTTTF